MRDAVKKRDKYQCVVCGNTKASLHVHHKMYGKDPWSVPMRQLETLCHYCHEKRTFLNKLIESIDSSLMLRLYDRCLSHRVNDMDRVCDIIDFIEEKDIKIDSLIKQFVADKAIVVGGDYD